MKTTIYNPELHTIIGVDEGNIAFVLTSAALLCNQMKIDQINIEAAEDSYISDFEAGIVATGKDIRRHVYS
jgi:hypothetical protein